MRYLSVAETAKKWNMSERSVRNYCANGRVNGAFLTGKTWNIPESAVKPERLNKKEVVPATLLEILQDEKKRRYSGGIYHKTQIDLTYNSNHMEGSRLTHDQTRYIFETNTIGVDGEALNVDDVIETANHFRCIDMIIDNAKAVLTEKFVKELHLILKNGTSDSRKDWFAVGDYKRLPNEVGGMETVLPEDVAGKMKTLLTEYNKIEKKLYISTKEGVSVKMFHNDSELNVIQQITDTEYSIPTEGLTSVKLVLDKDEEHQEIKLKLNKQ